MITEEYLRKKLGNDEEFFKKLFDKYLIFKIVDYELLPVQSRRLLDGIIKERERQIPERLLSYFKAEVGIGKFAEIENKTPIDLTPFDGKTVVVGTSMLRISGNKIIGIVYE